MNLQKAEGQDHSPLLDVVSIFKTIQGEGPWGGRVATFVRLAGCTLQCRYCVVGNTTITGPGWHKPIKDIQIGDEVLGWDGFQIGVHPVLETMVRETESVLKVSFDSGQPLFITPEHPGYVIGKGWVAAGNWHIGDVLFHCTPSDSMRVHNPMRNPETVRQVQTTRRETGANERFRQAIVDKWKDLSHRERQSQRMKAHNPMQNVEVRKRSWTNRTHSMSSIESFVWGVIQELELPIDFTGDGSFWVDGHCPDFKVRDMDKVIEVWDSTQSEFLGRDENYEVERQAYYQRNSFECLILAFNPSEFREPGDPKGTGLKNCRTWLAQKLGEFVHNGAVITKIELINRSTNPKAYARLAGSLNAPILVYNLEVDHCHNYFARNVLLHNCDTDYTSRRALLSVEEVVRQVERFGVERVVLTGGEPLRQRASTDLLLALNKNGFQCQVETSGSVCFGAAWQALPETALPIVVCSPKTGKIISELTPFITDYKYVVEEGGVDESDGLPNRSPLTGKALRLARPTVDKDHIFISPWDVQDEEQNWKNTQTAVRICLQHGYRLSLQIHKLVGLP